jgi:protein SCO1
MLRYGLWMSVVVGLLVCVGCAPALPEGVRAENWDAAIDFTLIDQQGQETHLHDLRGQFVLLAFGYTHCPDICPITLATFRRIKEQLGDQAAQVTFVWVSVDGTRDTPERLREYISMFDPAFVGMTGDEAASRAAISAFNGDFTLNTYGGLRENYTVDHTASTFLVDPQGRWVRTYSYGTNASVIAQDVIGLLG